MVQTIKGETYYRTGEACKLAGISKMTYLRWVKEQHFEDVSLRDRRGWRLFTEDDLYRLIAETDKISKVSNDY